MKQPKTCTVAPAYNGMLRTCELFTIIEAFTKDLALRKPCLNRSFLGI
jgi:hypothetical protein